MSAAAIPLAILRGRVKREELELESAVRELAAAAKQSVTPVHWIRERPLICMTGALAIGLWWGSRQRSRGRRAWR